ncbi:hypothetical protein D3C72_1653490 [compost metagenome]
MLVLARRIDDLHHLAAFVMAVAGGVAQRVGFAAAVAALIVAVAPALAGLVGLYPGQRPVFQPQG